MDTSKKNLVINAIHKNGTKKVAYYDNKGGFAVELVAYNGIK